MICRAAAQVTPMDVTVLLAKVLGLFLTIVGAAIMLRRRFFLPVFGTYRSSA